MWRTSGTRNRIPHIQEVHSYRRTPGILPGGKTVLVLLDRFFLAEGYARNVLELVVFHAPISVQI